MFRDPNTGIVSVSTYDLIMEVNRQPLVFSNDFGAAIRSGKTGGMTRRRRRSCRRGGR